MKLKKIVINNIHSLKGKHEIDFERLRLESGGLFAIVGPTGAGKSTILDAVLLALYGKIPRDSRNTIVSKSEKVGFVELWFENHGKNYVAKWSVTSHRKVNTPQREIVDAATETQLTNTSKLVEVQEKIENIIGLNYEQFTRSIILAQNQFSQFLKANDDDKSKLLEAITGDEIYSELGKAAFEKEKIEAKKIQEFKDKIAGLNLLTTDELSQINEEIDALNSNIETKKAELKKAEKQREIADEIEKSEAILAEISEKITNLESEYQEFKENGLQKLRKHELVSGFQVELYNYQKIQSQIPKIREEIELQESKFEAKKNDENKLSKELYQLENKKEILKSDFERIKPNLEKAFKIETEIELENKNLEELKTKLSELEVRLEKLQEIWKKITEKLSEIEDEIKEVNSFNSDNSKFKSIAGTLKFGRELFLEIHEKRKFFKETRSGFEQSKKEITILEEQLAKQYQALEKEQEQSKIFEIGLGKISEFLENSRNADLIQERKSAESALEQIQNNLDNLQKLEEISEFLDDNNNKISAFNSELSTNQIKLESLKKEQNLNQKNYDLSLKIKSLETERTKLIHGETCPLCGSKKHPFLDHESEILKETTEINTLKNELEVISENILSLEKSNSTLSEKINQCTNSVVQLEEQKQEIHSVFDAANANRDSLIMEKAKIIAKIETLETQIIQNEKQREEKDALQLKLNEQNQIIDKLKSSIQGYEHELDKLSATKKQHLESCENLEQEGKKLRKKLDENYPEDIFGTINLDFFDKTSEILLKIEENEVKIGELASKKDELIKEKVQIDSQIDSLETQIFEIKEVHNTKVQLIESQKTIIKEMFPELSPNETKQHFEVETEKFELEIEQVKTKIQEGELVLQKLKTAIENHSETLEKSSSELDVITAKLNAELLSIPEIESIELALGFLLDKSLLSEIKEKNDSYLEQIIQQNQLKESSEKSLESMKSNLLENFSKNDNAQKINLLESEVKILEDDLVNMKAKISNQEQQEKVSLELNEKLSIQKKIHQPWELLKKEIGSADGKDFRTFAQSLTLAKILQVTNEKMFHLTDGRYFMKTANENSEKISLELFIVDRWQNNAERPVKSLSGGETFLASLSLAIALSKIISGKYEIDAFFIDEGFGALDPEALDLVIDALEKLRIQENKLIGIISHVEKIKERFGTNLKLEKQSDGFSTVSY